jgi:hypothetical protein
VVELDLVPFVAFEVAGAPEDELACVPLVALVVLAGEDAFVVWFEWVTFVTF